jgi:hypothetical protein
LKVLAVPGVKALGDVVFYSPPGTVDVRGALKNDHDKYQELLRVIGVINHAFKKRGSGVYKTFTKRVAGEGKVGAWVTDKTIVVGLPK